MIRVEIQPPLAIIRLARPDKRNAMTPDMLGSLVTAIGQVGASEARAFVLCGEGAAFCAGFDLTLCKDSPGGGVMRALLTGLSEAIVALRAQPLPVVIAAHGAAIAGGCALLGAADLVITNDDAKLGYPVVRLGVSPAVSAPFLRLMVGDGPARERLLDPALQSGRDAVRTGLATESLAKAEEVLPRAIAVAKELAMKPPSGMAATRRWLAEVEGVSQSWEALSASLSLTGGPEEAELLKQAWAPKA